MEMDVIRGYILSQWVTLHEREIAIKIVSELTNAASDLFLRMKESWTMI
jgi:hypothetical protein